MQQQQKQMFEQEEKQSDCNNCKQSTKTQMLCEAG